MKMKKKNILHKPFQDNQSQISKTTLSWLSMFIPNLNLISEYPLPFAQFTSS